VGAIVGGFFLAQTHTPAQPSRSVSVLATPAATASGASITTGRQVSMMSRHPQSERATVPSPSTYSVDGGVLSYIDYAGQRIAIGRHDDLIAEDPPSD